MSIATRVTAHCTISHIVWTPDETDAEKILTAFHLLNWRRPPGRPLMDEDYPAGPEIQQPLPEWSNWHGSESSTLETDVYVWRYTLLVVHATKDVNKSGMAELWISHLGLPRTCNEVSEATDVVTELVTYDRPYWQTFCCGWSMGSWVETWKMTSRVDVA